MATNLNYGDAKITYNGWTYILASDKYNEDNWGIDVYNEYDERVCSLLHKSFDDFKNPKDLAEYVAEYIEQFIY